MIKSHFIPNLLRITKNLPIIKNKTATNLFIKFPQSQSISSVPHSLINVLITNIELKMYKIIILTKDNNRFFSFPHPKISLLFTI